ncbi:aminoglycoside phosphotransferase family protein [Paenibacillus sp. PR3]|uniref:Aminoglycoside phosphotransferase family protein n=1 Tax=Paenibacillus terricola TaxID=2763503 RepID=A0ABR8N2F7_9BACL|nr:aminoglycoside phosphotransferase family protein [Paenibacillus terricola]MBD3922060.1 aminoglycoside phosphotransferase family protein [Paenibacillus terricola]
MHNVFGTGYLVTDIARIHGGAQKVVYKIDCRNGFACVLYVWDLSRNYFREEIMNDSGSVFQGSYGGGLFAMNNRCFRQHGIRTPALYDLNEGRDRHPFDFALVEYIKGQKAEAYFQHEDPKVRDELFHRVGSMLSNMHAIERNHHGNADSNDESNDRPCFEVQRKHAEKALAYASEHMAGVRENYSVLLDKLYELEAGIEPRDRYSFIHGELGPDHILIDHEHMQPYLIDIEGAGFFDLEHEHSFLELRFGDFYRYLRNTELDDRRMIFYRYAHHLSLISGGLKLLYRQFPDQQFAKSLAEYHARRAIQMASGGSS